MAFSLLLNDCQSREIWQSRRPLNGRKVDPWGDQLFVYSGDPRGRRGPEKVATKDRRKRYLSFLKSAPFSEAVAGGHCHQRPGLDRSDAPAMANGEKTSRSTMATIRLEPEAERAQRRRRGMRRPLLPADSVPVGCDPEASTAGFLCLAAG